MINLGRVTGAVACWLAAGTVALAADAPSGRWSGDVTQVGAPDPYKIILQLGHAIGVSRYPELSCTGRVRLVAARNGYWFYTETIDTGRYSEESGEGCIDGSFILTRVGDQLAWSWVGGLDGIADFAYAILDPGG